LTVAATGVQGKDAFDVKLDVPAAVGSRQTLKATAMTVDAVLKQDGRDIKLKLSSPLNGNLPAQQFSLPQLTAIVSAAGPGIPGKSISGDLAGAASIDLKKEQAQLNLSGKTAGSTLKARVGVTDFSPAAFNF